METLRQQRVQSLIQKELGEYIRIQNTSWFPNILLTVTRVLISKDLAVAKIYISIFGKISHESILNFIRDHSKDIRYQLGLRIGKQMRIVPELIFYEDSALDYIENIDRLLKQ